jgi:hypothetical protein
MCLLLNVGGMTKAINFERGQRFVAWMKENQAVCFGVLFLCNVMSSQLISTGAFEVTLPHISTTWYTC